MEFQKHQCARAHTAPWAGAWMFRSVFPSLTPGLGLVPRRVGELLQLHTFQTHGMDLTSPLRRDFFPLIYFATTNNTTTKSL